MAVPLTLIILLLITGTNMTSTNIYIQSRIDELEELLADSHIKLFTIKYSKTDTPSINGNLIHNKKVVDHINHHINFVDDLVNFQEKVRYFLLGVEKQHCCVMCNTRTKIQNKTCSVKCKSAYYSINPVVIDALKKSNDIIKNTTVDGVPIRTIWAATTRATRIKNGGYTMSDSHKLKLSISRGTIDPIAGLTPAQKGGKMLSTSLSKRSQIDKDISSKKHSDRMLEIIACDIATKNEVSRGWVCSMLCLEKLKNTIDPDSGKTLLDIKQSKTGKTKRKNRPTNEMSEYRRFVTFYTRLSIKNYGHTLENIDLRCNHAENNNAYHIDHMFSVYEGFHRNIPPYIIGSIYNLKVIPWRENISKSSSNSISEEELFDRFYKETTNSPTDSPSSIDFS